VDEDKPQIEKKLDTKTKIGVSLLVGALASGFAWLMASADYSVPPRSRLNFDEGDTEYSTPELVLVPEHLMKRVRDGAILLHWMDDSEKSFFKTALRYELKDELVDEEES
jgi:hypothetical protein